MSYNINKKSKTKEKFRSFLSTFTCQVLTLSQYMLSAVVWMGSVPHRLMHLNTVSAGTEGWEDCGMFRIWRFAVGNVSLRLYSPAPFLNHSLLSECRRDMTSQLPACCHIFISVVDCVTPLEPWAKTSFCQGILSQQWERHSKPGAIT